MRLENKLVSATGSEPITSVYLKNYLRVDFSTDDDIINSVISAARELVEQYLETAILQKSLKSYFYDFQDWDEMEGGYYYLELPISPVTSVSAVKKVSYDGTETATTDYQLTGLDQKIIRIAKNLDLTGAITVGYIVEYVAERTTVEEPIKEAIAKLAGELYENRQDSGVDITVSSLPFDVKRLLTPYKKTFI